MNNKLQRRRSEEHSNGLGYLGFGLLDISKGKSEYWPPHPASSMKGGYWAPLPCNTSTEQVSPHPHTAGSMVLNTILIPIFLYQANGAIPIQTGSNPPSQTLHTPICLHSWHTHRHCDAQTQYAPPHCPSCNTKSCPWRYANPRPPPLPRAYKTSWRSHIPSQANLDFLVQDRKTTKIAFYNHLRNAYGSMHHPAPHNTTLPYIPPQKNSSIWQGA